MLLKTPQYFQCSLLENRWGDGVPLADIEQYESSLRVQVSLVVPLCDLARLVMEYTTYAIPSFSQTDLICTDSHLRDMVTDCVSHALYLVLRDEKENGVVSDSPCQLFCDKQLVLTALHLHLPDIAKQCERAMFAAHDDFQWVLFGNDVDWAIAFRAPSAEWHILPTNSFGALGAQQLCYFPTSKVIAFGSQRNPGLALVGTSRWADIYKQSVYVYDLKTNRWAIIDMHPRENFKDCALVCICGRVLCLHNKGQDAFDCTSGVYQKVSYSVSCQILETETVNWLSCVYDDRTGVLLAVGCGNQRDATRWTVVAFQVMISADNELSLHPLAAKMVTRLLNPAFSCFANINVGEKPGTLLLRTGSIIHLVC